jgi:FkbM family methyltransferase
MLIPFDQVFMYVAMRGQHLRGVLHVGAHECEEKEMYNKCEIEDAKIVWIDGNDQKIREMKQKFPDARLYSALIDDQEREVKFYITNNGQSSSILPLDTHKQHYPDIVVSEEQVKKTTTLKRLIEDNNIDPKDLNFWNLDIQGVELSALRGAGDYLKYADAIYSEVNVEHLYEGCALLPELDAFLKEKGFERVAMKLMPQGWGDALYIRTH